MLHVDDNTINSESCYDECLHLYYDRIEQWHRGVLRKKEKGGLNIPRTDILNPCQVLMPTLRRLSRMKVVD